VSPKTPRRPDPHPSGATPPSVPATFVPDHVAIVMDGNGRWANQRGLPRTEGHRAGEAALLDVMAGAIEIGVKHVSVYAFSTENWKRSPDEVRFLMGFSKDVLRRQRDQLDEWGVRIRWSGRRPRLWQSVVKELEVAEQQTIGNSTCTLNMCVNYGGRAEIADAAAAIAADVAAGRLKASTCSCAPPASSASPISCSGSPPTPKWSLWTPCGRMWTGGRFGRPSRFMPAATAVTAAPWMRQNRRGRGRAKCPIRRL
jgi:undecaprenyl diphosphate synthase